MARVSSIVDVPERNPVPRAPSATSREWNQDNAWIPADRALLHPIPNLAATRYVDQAQHAMAMVIVIRVFHVAMSLVTIRVVGVRPVRA